MKLIEEIANRNKSRCEILLKSFERLTDVTRYQNPPKDIQHISNIYANTMLYVFAAEPVSEEVYISFVEGVLSKIEDKDYVWFIKRLLFNES